MTNSRWRRPLALVLPCAAIAAASAHAETDVVYEVPYVADAIDVDGRLDEPCYRRCPPLTRFVDAADPDSPIPATKVWLFWSRDRLTLACECDDPTPVAAAPSDNERDVDPQDRVELFLWSGRASDTYYCLELAAQGAVHDYKARFYRQFDDSWRPAGLRCAVRRTTSGYVVEATLTHEDLQCMGFALESGACLRAGLFRADFDRLGGTPTWITWVRADTREPDFHVAESFGTLRLIGGEK